ncbi:hepatic sodium/bile acid cotransporter-like [Paramormyrops kingsleyae]|uniref:Hepatic sodium/bile acid cotransporter n=1 Tax=Paramormyrops kingsleyae TaxID=1676925 RepID=A0A3B3SUK3_9TELE|nr:sodium/bile acid cotransporter-like [Paramormyrops kingsleyae]
MNEILNETLGLYSSTVPSNFSLLSPAFANSTTTLQLPHSVALDKAINIVTIIILFITMVSLGCTMEIPKIKAYMMKPREVLLAVLTQYGIMPLTAFLMAKVFQLSPLEAVTVLICGCSPGGNLSNILAWAFQGDMNLSIVMTTCSTALALGMMPLLLYLYCKGIPDIQNAVPFMGIFIALLMTLLPCAIGIAINHRFPRFSHIITKMGMGILLVSAVIIAILIGMTIGSEIMLIMTPPLIATASLMPLTGYVLGYLLSTAFRFSGPCRRTVSMETGCQNIQLCATILKVAFPPETIGPLYLFPLLYNFFQAGEPLLFAVLLRCHQKFSVPVEAVKPEEKHEYLSVDRQEETGP